MLALDRARRASSALVVAVGLSAAVAAAVAAEVGDVVLDRRSTGSQMNAVIFPHWRHRTRFKCYACHPSPFEMRAGANDISMDALRAGEFCGRCHDGRTAFAIGFDTCRTCHSLQSP